MLDIDELCQAMEKELIPIKSHDSDSNLLKSYSFKTIGTGPFLKIFKNKPTKKELSSSDKVRYNESTIDISNLSDSIIKSQYTYLSNQWTYDKTNLSLSALIDFIRKNLPKYVKIDFQEMNEEYQFYAYEKNEDIGGDEESEIIEKILSKEELKAFYDKINSNIDNYKVKPLKTTRRITDDQLKKNFISRLKTQNRKYADGKRCFYPIIINRLYPEYTKYLETQFDNIIVYEGNKKPNILSSYTKFYIEEGDFYGVNKNKEKIKLHFMIGKELHPFKNFITRLKDISIEHVESMHSILDFSDSPALQSIANVVFSNENLNPKLKKDLDILEKKIRDKNKYSSLETELKILQKKTVLELLPRKINSAKNNK